MSYLVGDIPYKYVGQNPKKKDIQGLWVCGSALRVFRPFRRLMPPGRDLFLQSILSFLYVDYVAHN